MKTVFENITFTLKRVAKSKSLRIIIRPGGGVVVTAPKWLPQYKVREYVQAHAEWIKEKLLHASNAQKVFPSLTSQELVKVKKMALISFSQRLLELNEQYNFVYKRVSIRNQSTRWGSCSKTGTLSFNYRLYFLRPELQDYVLVHELCHLKEMNHSVKFWGLVERVVPDYKELRRELKKLRF